MDKKDITVCPTVGHKVVEMCVPVYIKPFARVGTIETKCLGKARVSSGTSCCESMPLIDACGECNFTISQKVLVEVPVGFGVESATGEVHGDCGEASADNDSDGCGCNCGCSCGCEE